MMQTFSTPAPQWAHFPLVLIVGAVVMQPSLRAQVVDCVNPASMRISRIRGQVFDPSGQPIPEANVVVLHDKKQVELAKGDSDGRFDVSVPSGEYSLKASFPHFQSLNVEVHVGADVPTIAHPTTLYVILGLAGSFCSWATISKRDFQREISVNNRRIDEAAHRNATQN